MNLVSIPTDNLNVIIQFLNNKDFFNMIMSCKDINNYYKDWTVKNNKHKNVLMFFDKKPNQSIYYEVNRYILSRNPKSLLDCFSCLSNDYNENCHLVMWENIDKIKNITIDYSGLHYINSKTDSDYVCVISNKTLLRRNLHQLQDSVNLFLKDYPCDLKSHYKNFSWLIFDNYKSPELDLFNILGNRNTNNKKMFLLNSQQEIIDFCIELLTKDSWWGKFIKRDILDLPLDEYMRYILKEANAKQKQIFNNLMIVKIPHNKIIHHCICNNRLNLNLYCTHRTNEYKYKSLMCTDPYTGDEKTIVGIHLIYYLIDNKLIKII